MSGRKTLIKWGKDGPAVVPHIRHILFTDSNTMLLQESKCRETQNHSAGSLAEKAATSLLFLFNSICTFALLCGKIYVGVDARCF